MTPDTHALPANSVTAGLIDAAALMADLKCSSRTIDRYRQAGMPFIKLGATILFNPAAVRDWIMSHQRQHETPKRGRPATKRAA